MAQTVKDSQPICLVSFVVPAWNEEALLGQTLKSIFAAAQPLNVPFEVVVADDASTDRTAEIAREHGAQVVSINRRQIAATRNAGARAAKGELLIFVDADTLVTPEVIRAALGAIRAGAVGGGCAVNFDGRVPGYARRLLPLFTRVYRAAGLAAGCFLFCTRRAFDAVGGFDEKFYASEECWMSWSLRRQGRFVLLRETVLTSARKLRTYSGGENSQNAVLADHARPPFLTRAARHGNLVRPPPPRSRRRLVAQTRSADVGPHASGSAVSQTGSLRG